MKKLLILFAFLGFVAINADAQSCTSAKKTTSASCTKDKASCASTAAAKAASLDENISKRVSNTGEVVYVKKSVCGTSGKVSYTAVEYCTKSNKFVNVSPKEKASCSSSKAGAVKTSATTKGAKGAACCSSGKAKTTSASCCAGGKKTSCDSKKTSTEKTSTSSDSKVKLVKNEAN